MKTLLVFLYFVPIFLTAQQADPLSGALPKFSESYILMINYQKVFDPNFSADAISGEGAWFIPGLHNADFTNEFSGETSLSLGPYGSLRFSSGKLNTSNYAEKFIVWTAGIIARLDFPGSRITLIPQYGRLSSVLDHYSGVAESFEYNVWSALLKIESDAGRRANPQEYFLTGWSMEVVAGTPVSPQRPFDWGFSFIGGRTNDQPIGTSSVHAKATLDIGDIPLGETSVIPYTIRGMGGKYNSLVKYFGLGFGIRLVVNDMDLVGISLDKMWNWDSRNQNAQSRGELANWQMNIEFNLGGFQQFWDSFIPLEPQTTP